MFSLILLSFVVLSVLISIEDILRKEVSIFLLGVYSAVCIAYFLLSGQIESLDVVSFVIANSLPLLLVSVMVLLGKTGIGDVVYLVGLVLVFSKPLEVKGICFLIPFNEPLFLTTAEVTVINSLALLLRKEAFDRSKSRGSIVYLVTTLVPLFWALLLLDSRHVCDKKTAPFIPYMQLGVLIGLLLNQIAI